MNWKIGQRFLFSTVLLLAGVGAASADIDAFESLLGQPAHEISLAGDQLSVMAEAVRGDAPEMAQLFDGIDSVQVRHYELGDAMDGAVGAGLTEAADGLTGQGWIPLVSVRDDVSLVRVLLDSKGGVIYGLVALFADEREAGVVKIDGRLEMATALGVIQNLKGLPRALEGLGDMGFLPEFDD